MFVLGIGHLHVKVVKNVNSPKDFSVDASALWPSLLLFVKFSHFSKKFGRTVKIATFFSLFQYDGSQVYSLYSDEVVFWCLIFSVWLTSVVLD